MGWTISQLHEAVRTRLGDVRGTSYGAIRNHVKGHEVDHPRMDVVRAIAEALGVNFLYLMDLEGPRTSEEAAAHWYSQEESRRFASTLLRWRALDRAPLPFPRDYLVSEGDSLLSFAANAILESNGRRLEDYSEEDAREAVALVAWLWTLPLRAVGIDLPAENPPPDDLRNYWLAIANAWAQATGARRWSESEGGDDPLAYLRTLRQRSMQGTAETPTHFRLMPDGLRWGGPFCPNHDLPAVAMHHAGNGLFRCPECGHEVDTPAPKAKKPKNKG